MTLTTATGSAPPVPRGNRHLRHNQSRYPHLQGEYLQCLNPFLSTPYPSPPHLVAELRYLRVTSSNSTLMV